MLAPSRTSPLIIPLTPRLYFSLPFCKLVLYLFKDVGCNLNNIDGANFFITLVRYVMP